MLGRSARAREEGLTKTTRWWEVRRASRARREASRFASDPVNSFFTDCMHDSCLVYRVEQKKEDRDCEHEDAEVKDIQAIARRSKWEGSVPQHLELEARPGEDSPGDRRGKHDANEARRV